MEWQNFIREEVKKLLDVGFICEIHHPEWLANPVVITKVNDKLHMCVDYTSLNKACPKDPYPLPCIDEIEDSSSGYELLSFIDGYSRFHQIQMAREDEQKTTFITPDGLYCYISMPYGLKNVLPTFVRATTKTFQDNVHGIIEVYVDDIVAKTRQRSSILLDVAQVFDMLRSTRMMLNLEKSVFWVFGGKLLGFLVLHRGVTSHP
jgi:hypothetical protein